MAAGKRLFVHCDQMEKFPYPASCPFNTSRGGLVKKTVNAMGLLSGDDIIETAGCCADRNAMAGYHTDKYLDAIQRASEGHFDQDMLYFGLGTGDCPVFKHMYDNFAWATGATMTAVDAILAGEAKIAFNPSGGLHHAHANRASGFCYINDQVLACRAFAEAGKRVLYLDIDVHHGDGVQEAFYNRSDVMTISLHQNGMTLFPGTGFIGELGEGEGEGFSVNLPLPPFTYDEAYLKVFNAGVMPLIRAFDPDVISLELGVDTLADDPLAQLMLTNNVHVEIITSLLALDKLILATGGGGYNINNTVRAWSLAWAVLAGRNDATDRTVVISSASPEITDFEGGLRDTPLSTTDQQHEIVDDAIDKTIDDVKKNIFSLHGLAD